MTVDLCLLSVDTSPYLELLNKPQKTIKQYTWRFHKQKQVRFAAGTCEIIVAILGPCTETLGTLANAIHVTVTIFRQRFDRLQNWTVVCELKDNFLTSENILINLVVQFESNGHLV